MVQNLYINYPMSAEIFILSRTLSIPKEELSQFFDQCLHSNFRIWLSEIRFNAAKHASLPHLQNQRRVFSNRMESLKKRQKTGKKV